MFTESVFSKVTKKGKRRSSGIEGFRNMIHSLLNGNGGNTLLCNGLIPVCYVEEFIVFTQQDCVSTSWNLPNI